MNADELYIGTAYEEGSMRFTSAPLSALGRKVVIELQNYPTADEFDKEEYMIRPPALGLTDDEARSLGFHRLRRFMLRGMIGCDGASTVDDLIVILAAERATGAPVRSRLGMSSQT